MLAARNLTVIRGAQVVLDRVDLVVDGTSRIGMLGRNGAGKTTLLRCLAGLYTPDAGTVRLGANVTMGFYAQEHEDIPPGATVLEVMREASTPGQTESELRAILAHFGLVGDVSSQEAVTLSGGEKTKLSLARLVGGRANVLLLDEPTNNLDPSSREAVLAALQHFKGTVVLVSHDVEFVARVADEVVVMAGGEVVSAGPVERVLAESPAFAPQLSKILGPGWLTVDQVREVLV